MEKELTAATFLDELKSIMPSNGNTPMGKIFALAKSYMGMPITEIKLLLQSPGHEARVGAVSIMDFDARSKSVTPERRKQLYELYIQNHDYIDTWDLVDRSAPYVVGGYLSDKPRDILYKLARSDRPMERRSAIAATYYFIRQNDVEDTFKIAELLATDRDDLVQKAVGGWIREAGKRNPERLLAFLDKYAAKMPRIMLTYAVEKLSAQQKARYRSLK